MTQTRNKLVVQQSLCFITAVLIIFILSSCFMASFRVTTQNKGRSDYILLIALTTCYLTPIIQQFR